jgi:hypothetical protein
MSRASVYGATKKKPNLKISFGRVDFSIFLKKNFERSSLHRQALVATVAVVASCSRLQNKMDLKAGPVRILKIR